MAVIEKNKLLYGRLVIETGENEGLVFTLRESIVSIGRGPENTIQIIDAHMSRQHTLLIQNDKGWIIRDMGSRNGTQVNGIFINTDLSLSHGDHIQIGNTTFVFEQDDLPGLEEASGTTGVRVTRQDSENEKPVAEQICKLRDELGNDSEITSIFEVPTHDRARLNVLYALAEAINSTLNLDELLGTTLDLLQRSIKPERASILLYEPRYQILLPKAVRRAQNVPEQIIIPHSIIDEAIREQAALLISDAARDQRFKESDSVARSQIHSAVCAPLVYRREVLGVLYMDRRMCQGAFEENDLRLVCGIANQAALAIANSRMHHKLLEQHGKEREMEIARSIQQNLLPKAMPRLQDFEIAGISQPAHMVGGDYFDVIPLPDGRYVLAIADVSGKGVPAAILIAAVRAAVQIEVRAMPHVELVEIVNRLNQMVCRDTSGAMFVTMLLAVLDPVERTLTYCNAGHVHPILFRTDETHETLDAGGCFLGIMPGLAYEKGVIALEEGTVLLMYSDGVTDMMNDSRELYGVQRLLDFMELGRGLSAEAICRQIADEAKVFRGDAEPFDDLTLLVLKAL